jgi:hypoxanthine phosphoribosyltransferase
VSQTIQLHDKSFAIDIREERILEAVAELALRINRELQDERPLFLGVLNGSFMFLSDLMKCVDIPCEVSFVKVASYDGTSTTGQVKQILGLNENIAGRTVVIVEDIVDTGHTIQHLFDLLQSYEPKQIKIATLLFKPEAYTKSIPLDYVALEVPNDFLVGYGLDYDGLGRNLKHIYKITQ